MTVLYLLNMHRTRTLLSLKETSRLRTQRETIGTYIQSKATDVLIVSKHYELRMMIESGDGVHRERLSEEFLALSRSKRIYDQVRFLDETGMEVLRVNFNDGKPGAVPPGERGELRSLHREGAPR